MEKKWKKQKVVKLPDSFGSTGDQCCHSLQTPPTAFATIVTLTHFLSLYNEGDYMIDEFAE